METTVTTIERGHDGYPSRLLDLTDPPERLHLLGAIPEGPAVAIVGARAADRRGLGFAERLAEGLAVRGVTVVSGGARGIDQAAHQGALEAPGRTVVVLGCGLGVDYPRGTGALRQRAARAGAVVTELELDEPPRPHNFPRRNRIVAALADAVVVVQAGARSGALSTARLARELGRPVLAVPGEPGAPLSVGTNGLLRRGALVAEGPADVLAALGSPPEERPEARSRPAPARRLAAPPVAPLLAGLAAALHAALGRGAASVDELSRQLGEPVEDVTVELVELELAGLVRSRGGCYERV